MRAILWPDSEGNLPPSNFETMLADRLRGRVERAYLFGSYGTEAFRAGSDVDLILVVDTSLPFVERGGEFLDLYDFFPRIDILVYTADELKTLLAETVGFWASVKATLRELPVAS